MVVSGGSGVILEFLEWLEGLWQKRQGSCGMWKNLGDFCGFLEWFRTYL
jgi:hypothetical protein